MGNSCRYVVSTFVDFVNASVHSSHAPHKLLVGGGRGMVDGGNAVCVPSHPEEHDPTKRRRGSQGPVSSGRRSCGPQWILPHRQDYFLIDMVQGQFGSSKYVAEVGRIGHSKTYIFKKQCSHIAARSEFLALSIANERNGYMVVAKEYMCLNGVHYFIYDKEDVDMFTIMSQPEYAQYRKRTSVEGYIRHMIMAVRYMHSHAVIHGDLKFENMVVNLRTLRLRLIDFESCQLWSTPKRFSGTEDYMAPEIFFINSIPDYEPGRQDIWSIGILLAIILFDKDPCFPKPRRKTDYVKYVKSLPSHPFLSKCLDLDPRRRIDIHKLLHYITEDPYSTSRFAFNSTRRAENQRSPQSPPTPQTKLKLDDQACVRSISTTNDDDDNDNQHQGSSTPNSPPSVVVKQQPRKDSFYQPLELKSGMSDWDLTTLESNIHLF